MNNKLIAITLLDLVLGAAAGYLFAHAAIVTTVVALLILVSIVVTTPRTAPVVSAMAGWVLVSTVVALPFFFNHDLAIQYADESGLFFAVSILVGPVTLGGMHGYRRFAIDGAPAPVA
jgi:hypothetical protein